MKRIVFYGDNEWALGSIQYELSKRLYVFGYDCQVLPWNKSYYNEEMNEYDPLVDTYVTMGMGYTFLRKYYKICVPPQKCVVVIHSKQDVDYILKNHSAEEIISFKSLTCVSQKLVEYCEQLGVPRKVMLTPLGVNVDAFNFEIPEKLKTIGYAGSSSATNRHSQDIKRYNLIEKVANRTGLEYVMADTYHNTFVSMPGFYKRVDCVIVPSTEEGAGLPALEAGAAGRLVLSTPVGHWEERAYVSGITMPFNEIDFIEKASEVISYYKDNPEIFRQKCKEIKTKSACYDWSHSIKSWIEAMQ